MLCVNYIPVKLRTGEGERKNILPWGKRHVAGKETSTLAFQTASRRKQSRVSRGCGSGTIQVREENCRTVLIPNSRFGVICSPNCWNTSRQLEPTDLMCNCRQFSELQLLRRGHLKNWVLKNLLCINMYLFCMAKRFLGPKTAINKLCEGTVLCLCRFQTQ